MITRNDEIVSDVDLWTPVQLHIFAQPPVCE